MYMENAEYEKVIKDINILLNDICKDDRMKYHIIPVVNISIEMAKKLHADVQVVAISAYLHDITKILGDKKNHHISGAKYAREFLGKYKIKNEKIELIEECIKNHRGSIEYERKTLEEKIVATADAVAHLQHPLTLFYAWYGRRQCSIDDGAEGIKNKLQRSWNKIEFEYIKEEMKERYEALIKLLEEK